MNKRVVDVAAKCRRSIRALGVVGALTATALLVIAPNVNVGTAHATPPPSCGDSGTPAVVAVHGPHMYIDSGVTPKLDSQYIGYTVRAGSTSRSGLWIQVTSFTGGFVTLSTNEADSQPIADLSANQSATQYFLLKASGPTTSPQSHQVRIYQGEPGSGTLLCTRTGSILTVAETIKALANKVRSISASGVTDTTEIGDVVTITVEGDTGTLGAGPDNDPGVMSISPMAESTFPATAWRLERTQISIKPTGVEASPTVFVNRLYLPGSSGPDRPYTAIYTFRAVGSSALKASVRPIQYIASGTQVKHTDPGSIPLGELPVVTPVASLTLTKSASTSLILKSGSLDDASRTVTYTVSITNTGDGVGTLDDITDTLPPAVGLLKAAYVAGSTKFNGATGTDPDVLGQTITWSGPIRVPAFDSLTLTYNVLLPDLASTYTNTVEGHYGNAVIDKSASIDNSQPATVSVRILSTSGSLSAVADTDTTAANTQKTIVVTSNDTSTYGSLTVSEATDPTHGSTSVVSATSVLYTPDAGYSGTDTFTYTVGDGATTATATVTVTVTPKAVNDTYSTTNAAGLKSFSTVLANDACTSCTVTTKTLTTSSSPSIANGTMTLASDGTFTWERSTNSSATITFTYTATDGAGSTTTATVTLYVGKAVPDVKLIRYNTKETIDVLANDFVGGNPTPSSSDPPHGSTSDVNKMVDYTPDSNYWGTDSFTYSVAGASTAVNVLVEPPDSSTQTDLLSPISSSIATAACASCTYSVVTPPSSGSFLFSADGSYTYTPSSNGTFTATWRVQDPTTNLTSDADLTIKVGPRAVADSYTMFTGSTLSGNNVTTNDTCAATCTTTKVTPDSGFGTATVNSNGTFTFDPANEIGTRTFTYQISSTSAAGITSNGTVTITVEGAVDDEATTDLATAVDISVQSNDPCSDCTVSAVADPAVGTATIIGGQTVRYTPPNGFTGRVQFTYTVSKSGRSTNATITVYVRPSAVNDSAITTAGQPISLNVLTNDICARCTVTSVGTPNHGSASVSSNTVTYDPGGFTSANATDYATLTYTITNNYSKTSTATVSVYVGAAPSADDDSYEVAADSVLSFDARTNDSCKTCSVEKDSEPSRGAASILATNFVRFTPEPLSSGRVTFKYLLVDPVTGLFDSATITVDVLPLAADDSARTGINQQVSTDVAANDACTSCTIEILGSSGDANPQELGESGSDIVYRPATGFSGTMTINYRITDGSIDEHDDGVLTIIVDDALPDSASTPFETLVDVIDVIDNDLCTGCDLKSINSDARTLKGSVEMKQKEGKDRGVRFQPAPDTWGIEWFRYRAGPSQNSLQALKRSTYSSTRPFASGSWTVESTVTILVGPPAITVNATGGVPINGNLILGTPSNSAPIAATDCSTRCVFALVTAPDDGEITLNADGSYQYTAPLDGVEGGTDTFTYRVTDSTTGASQTGTVTFSVIPGTAELTLTKTAGTVNQAVVAPNTRVDAGDRISYTITVANTGNVTLSDVTVTDSKLATLDCDPLLSGLTLAPTDEIVCTGTYTITQADVNAGSVVNTADASAKVAGTTVTGTDSATTSLTRSNQVDIAKTTTATSLVKDASVPYTITVTNTGNTTLSAISVIDAKIPSLACSPELPGLTLLPSESTTCTGSHTVTQDDVDSGELINSATVEASYDPTDPAAVITDTASVTINSSGLVSASLTKTAGDVDMTVAGPDDRVDAGDQILYTITVENTGTASLSNFAISDEKLEQNLADGAIELTCSGLVGPVAPDESVSCTGTYVITQADIDAGSIANTASFEAFPPTGSKITGTGSTTVGLTQMNSIDLEKTADVEELPTSGDVVYTLTATNTGNTTLESVTITDDLAPCSIPIVAVTLDPGESASCTATYTVKEGDVSAGSVTNEAEVTGTTTVTGIVVESTATKVLRVPTSPLIDLDKSVTGVVKNDVGSDSVLDVGDKVVYSFTITNAGNTNLTGFVLDDTEVGNITCDPNDPPLADLTLAPAGVIQCSGSHVIGQDDLNAGVIVNEATVEARYDPIDPLAVVTDTDGATQEVSRVTGIEITKSAIPASLPDVGTDVTYTIEVTNTSNVPLSSITIDDPMFSTADGSTLSCDDDGASGTPFDLDTAVLEIEGTITCSGTHQVTDTEWGAGILVNTAVVEAWVHGAALLHEAQVTDSDGVSLTAAGAASASIVKTATLYNDVVSPDTSSEVGDRIDYSIEVTNTGDIPLDNLAVDDPMFSTADGSTLSCDDDGASGTPFDLDTADLLEGESITCVGSYILQSNDLENGSVSNTATFSYDANGTPLTISDDADTDLDVFSGIEVTKIATEATLPDLGDPIHYTITVENVGDQSIDDLTIVDTKIPLLTCDDDNDLETGFELASKVLPVGGIITCTGTYDVTQDDLDEGSVANQVDVDARTVTTDVSLSESAFFRVYEAAAPSINILKSADLPDLSASSPNDELNQGDTITYSFVITNTGNTPLDNLSIDDPLVGDVDCFDADDEPIDLAAIDLLEGEWITCWSDYEITQDDIDRGSVTNEAEVSGDFGETTKTDSSSTTTPLSRSAAIAVHKSADPDSIPDPLPDPLPDDGLMIEYTITVENVGTVTLTNLDLTDSLQADYEDFICDDDSEVVLNEIELAPGDELVCIGTYEVTDSDPITNEVEVTASGPDGEDVSASTTAVVTTEGSSSLEITKTATIDSSLFGENDRVDAGDEIVYQITATNTGELDISSVVISDAMVMMLTDLDCENDGDGDGVLDDDFVLRSDESTDCTGTYVITQNDLQVGTLENTASVSGTVGTTPLSAEVSIVTGLEQIVDVDIEKTADVDTLPSEGDEIGYTIVIVNNGNVILTDLLIEDDRIESLTCEMGDAPVDPAFLAFEMGDEIICRGVYTVTDDDVAVGTLTNNAMVEGAIADPVDPVDPGVGASSSSGRRELSSTFSTLTYSGEAGPSGGGSPSRAPEPRSIEPGTISGIVWFDLDNDGVKDDDEPALPGVTVGLDGQPSAPATVRAFRVRATNATGVITSASGAYVFTNVATGAHTIIADMTKDVGILKSWDSDGGSDWTVLVTVPESGEAVADVAGIGTKTVEGIAYDGTTGSPIAQPVITITWAGFDDTFDTDDDVEFSGSGDASGYFRRTGLPIGKFTCQSSDPATGLANDSVSFELTAESVDPTFIGCPSVLPKTGLDLDRSMVVGLYLLGLGLAVTSTTTIARRRRRTAGIVVD